MSLGVQSGTTGSLQIRKLENGIVLDSTPPQTHEFPRRWLTREINDAVRLMVTIPTDPPLHYEITQVSQGGDLIGHRIELPTSQLPDKPRRRWWQRKKHG